MEKKNSLGIFALSTIVVGSMIGGGIFNMPKNIAQSSSAGAAIIGWLISGIGVLFLAKTFQILATETPDVTDGIYKYAKEGFGTFSGFHSAWGYWISNVISNAS
ncbi:MAG: amino acid permease, partial [Cetobacterium sp.]